MNQEVYYKDYQHRGHHLESLLYGLKEIGSDCKIFESVKNKEQARYLVLGSATERNLDNMALIDNFLRPRKVTEDVVTIIDYNFYPLEIHQKRIKFFVEWNESIKKNNKDSGEDPLPYPKFELAQADICNLPFADKSMNVIISHYTLNFLSTIEAVNAAFSEIVRVLADDGVALITIQTWVQFHERHLVINTPHKSSNGSADIYKFTPKTYLDVLINNGLKSHNCTTEELGYSDPILCTKALI